jgi:hypothetical protein
MAHVNVWQELFVANFDQAFRQLERALQDCPDELWETDLWPAQALTGPSKSGGLWGSAPWCLAHHALLCLDYDLTGDFEPWAPPAPFDENTFGNPNRVFTKPELLHYIDCCRDRVRGIAAGLTEDRAARPLPPQHRYRGTSYVVTVGGMALHVVEHAAQIREFLTAAGVQPAGGFVPGT